jgi:type II secretory pathway component GspD/PulD (secretin)
MPAATQRPVCTRWKSWYGVAAMGNNAKVLAVVQVRRLSRAMRLASCLLAAISVLHEGWDRTASGQVRSTVAPAAQMDLARLVDLCSQRLGLRIDYDPTVVKGPIMLRLPDTLTDDELWALTNQLLAQRGFATVRATNSESISVVRASEASQVARIEPGRGFDLEPVVGKAGFTSLVMAPEYRSAKDMAEALKPLLTKGVGSAVSLGGTRLLLVSDYTGRLAEIQSLIDRLDAPTEEMVVDEVMVANISPQTLVATVMQIVQKRDQVAGERLPGELIASPNGSAVIIVAPSSQAAQWKELIERFDKPEGIDIRNYVPRVFAVQDVARLIEDSIDGGATRDLKAASDGGWRVVVDDLTGTLVITATPSQHAQVVAIMERLDAAEGLVHPMRSYPIRNRPASEMQATLSRLIEAGALDANERIAARESVRSGGKQRFLRDIQSTQGAGEILPTESRATSALGGSPNGATGALQQREPGDRLRLTVDESTNTLIAIGEPRLLSQLETLIQMLDVRQPQVMLEAVFVSITDSDALNLGIELERLGSVNGAAYKVASLFGLSTAGSGARTVADSAGFTGLILDPGEFSVVVKALQAINKGRSLSNPQGARCQQRAGTLLVSAAAALCSHRYHK